MLKNRQRSTLLVLLDLRAQRLVIGQLLDRRRYLRPAQKLGSLQPVPTRDKPDRAIRHLPQLDRVLQPARLDIVSQRQDAGFFKEVNAVADLDIRQRDIEHFDLGEGSHPVTP